MNVSIPPTSTNYPFRSRENQSQRLALIPHLVINETSKSPPSGFYYDLHILLPGRTFFREEVIFDFAFQHPSKPGILPISPVFCTGFYRLRVHKDPQAEFLMTTEIPQGESALDQGGPIGYIIQEYIKSEARETRKQVEIRSLGLYPSPRNDVVLRQYSERGNPERELTLSTEERSMLSMVLLELGQFSILLRG